MLCVGEHRCPDVWHYKVFDSQISHTTEKETIDAEHQRVPIQIGKKMFF